MTDSIRIRARLRDPDGIGAESFWANPTDDPFVYEVANILMFVPIGLGDTVRVIERPDELPQVIEVVTRTDTPTIGVRIELATDEDGEGALTEIAISEAHKLFATKAEEAGAKTEGWQPGMLGVVLPAGVDSPEEWLDGILEGTVPDTFRVMWDYLSEPDGPTGLDSLDFLDVSGDDLPAPSTEVWNPLEDEAFVRALLAAKDSEDIPPWAPIDALLSIMQASFRYDSRVRDAVAKKNFDDVITLAVRGLAINLNLPLPPLERPLFETPKEDQDDPS